HYSFGELLGGNYTVSVNPATLPGGYSETYDFDGSGTANTSNVLLADGQNRTDVDFGYAGQNSVGDLVWYDVDGDGVQDVGEEGIGGLTVTLTADIDGDGDYEFTTTRTTAADGSYLIENLPVGNYRVTLTPPVGADPTFDADGTADNTTSFLLGSDDDRLDIDFGVRGAGSISDAVFFDTEGDGGVEGTGIDSYLPGVTVTITGDVDGDGIVDYTDSMVTDANGLYEFDDLLAGSYSVSIDPSSLPGGLTQTYDIDGTGSGNSVVDFLLGVDEDRDDIDFGYTGSGSIGDTVFFDSDADSGVEGTGLDIGISGVTVQLSTDINGDNIADYTTTEVTDANGHYLFTNLYAGTYTISVVPTSLPAGYIPTYDLDGIATVGSTEVVLAATEDRRDVDFGYTGQNSVGDLVWYDADGDGVVDPEEDGIGDLTVTLTADIDGDGTFEFTTTTTTLDDGSYSFDHLPAGDF
ncbi:MAG: hypothetical protein GY698_19625, partial [Actinomycetia bacterium]|nr:hypothetical protein [Actinomycetes bacterium]